MIGKEYTAEEKRQAFKQYEINQIKSYNRGRAIIIAIAAVNMIAALVYLIIPGSFWADLISAFISVALSLALFFGVVWVRYLYAISFGVSAFKYFVAAYITVEEMLLGNIGQLGYWLIAILVILIAYSIVSALLLLVSKSVSEFLYEQKNG